MREGRDGSQSLVLSSALGSQCNDDKDRGAGGHSLLVIYLVQHLQGGDSNTP